MKAYGYTPEEISNMTLEQTILGYQGEDKDSKIVHCSSLQEARRILQELQNV
jgi:hypothetical protein